MSPPNGNGELPTRRANTKSRYATAPKDGASPAAAQFQEAQHQSRHIKDAAFCWQHKKVLTFIRDTFSESDQAASALAVYVAMTKLGSDFGSETFTAAKALIAHTAGVSVSTVERLLKAFEQLGLVKIERRAIAGAFKAPNTYTLLAIRHCDVSIRHERRNLNPDKADTQYPGTVILRDLAAIVLVAKLSP
jgi:hypothetical protein